MRQHHLTGALLLTATLLAGSVSAEIYRSVDEHGNVTFTNQPVKGAEPVQLKPLSVYGAPRIKSIADSKAVVDKAPAYRSVTIIAPRPDETVRDNPGNVTVKAGSDPALNQGAGHRFQFFLDGKPVGDPQTAPTKTFANVDRGEHRVAVAVVDSRGKTIVRSEPVRFFLHRQTIFNPARRKAN